MKKFSPDVGSPGCSVAVGPFVAGPLGDRDRVVIDDVHQLPGWSPLGDASHSPLAEDVAITQNGVAASQSRSTSSSAGAPCPALSCGSPSRSTSSATEAISVQPVEGAVGAAGVVVTHHGTGDRAPDARHFRGRTTVADPPPRCSGLGSDGQQPALAELGIPVAAPISWVPVKTSS